MMQIVSDEEHYSPAKLVSVGSVNLKHWHGEFAFRMELVSLIAATSMLLVRRKCSSSAFFIKIIIGIPRQYS